VTPELVKAEPCPANFNGCLVEGSLEEKKRGRKIRRRAIAVSLALEAAGVLALLIAPLFAKPPELSMLTVLPVPPYRHAPPARRAASPPPDGQSRRFTADPYRPVQPTPAASTAGVPSDGPGDERGVDMGSGDPFGLIAVDTQSAPPPPPPATHSTPRVHEPHISPALLVHRVEPVYPALARQLRRSGRVELHALIAADGTVQSLEVMSGDPLFVVSAREAVRQWRYRPTVLNGTPVEVDTFITVIYTLQ